MHFFKCLCLLKCYKFQIRKSLKNIYFSIIFYKYWDCSFESFQTPQNSLEKTRTKTTNVLRDIFKLYVNKRRVKCSLLNCKLNMSMLLQGHWVCMYRQNCLHAGIGKDYCRMLANYRCGGGKTRRAESARRRGSLPTKFIG